VNQFLEDSAERFPDKVALMFQDQRLTYTEIEARANRLANALLDHGVRRLLAVSRKFIAKSMPHNLRPILGFQGAYFLRSGANLASQT